MSRRSDPSPFSMVFMFIVLKTSSIKASDHLRISIRQAEE